MSQYMEAMFQFDEEFNAGIGGGTHPILSEVFLGCKCVEHLTG
jgi:hypothetical protein